MGNVEDRLRWSNMYLIEASGWNRDKNTSNIEDFLKSMKFMKPWIP